MHPKKFYCQHVSKGLRFLGSYLKYDRIYLDNRTIRRAESRIVNFNKCRNKSKHIEDFIATLNSYFGLMKNRNEFKTIQRLCGMIASAWWEFVHIDWQRLCVVANDGYKHKDLLKLTF